MTKASPRLLIVDDEEAALANLAHAFTKAGYSVVTRREGHAALAALAAGPFDVVLSDLRMPGIDGMALLQACRARYPETQVIMVTGYATLDSAVAAMQAGAFHYLAKPFRLEEVRAVVARALEMVQLRRDNLMLREQIQAMQGTLPIVTQDPATLGLLELARRVAQTDCNVLISGESGTGKELLARYVHHHGTRSKGSFVAINCGALHDELLANELFGHERGAFTGAHAQRSGLIEAATGGTLFLDEVGEISASMQVKMLRVLEQRELYRVGGNQPVRVDVRFLAATNRNLADAVAAGSFRHDLYFRLNVVDLHLPPLAERRGDVVLLAFHFLKRHAVTHGKDVVEIAPEVLDLLGRYAFPGNVRELSNLIERGVALAEGRVLDFRHLPESLRNLKVDVLRAPRDHFVTLETQEAHYIRTVLDHTGGNRTRAAEILGIDRVSLWRKLKRFGMEA
ncbi:MAG: sigma-54-dependent transcriptional regulator [Thiotrichales bacterium]